MSGRWFTNTRFAREDRVAWMRSSVGSDVQVGPPRATIHHSVEELKAMKMVGLYEIAPGVPPLPDPGHPKNAGEHSAYDQFLAPDRDRLERRANALRLAAGRG